MKHYKSFSCVLGIASVIVFSFSIQSCEKDEVSREPIVAQKHAGVTKEDLHLLADAAAEYGKLLHDQQLVTRSHPQEIDTTSIANIQTRMDSLFSAVYNITITCDDLKSDLTSSQIHALVLSPDTSELYATDPYAFSSYADATKSRAFGTIFRSIMNEGYTNTLTSNDIINNNGLAIHEQVSLILALECAKVVDNQVPIHNYPTEADCMRQFTMATGTCMGRLVAATCIAVGEAAVTGGALTPFMIIQYSVAIYDYISCIDTANDELELCRRRINH